MAQVKLCAISNHCINNTKVAKLYSPLFIKLTSRTSIPVTYQEIRERNKGRLEKENKQRQYQSVDAFPRTYAMTDILPGSVPEMSTLTPPDKTETVWRDNLNLQLICPDCKEVPANLIEEFSMGDTVCGSCGLVLGERIIDTRSEWRTFSNDDQGNDDPSRVGDGANPLLNGSQLQTNISFGDGGSGRSRDLHRAQNKSTHDKSTKSLLAAYKEIGSLGEASALNKLVTDTTKHLFKMVHDSGSFRGKSQEALIAGCLFIACRQCKVPRTFKEIWALTKVSKKEIGRIFKTLEKFFARENQSKVDALQQSGGKLGFSKRVVPFVTSSNFGYRNCQSQ